MQFIFIATWASPTLFFADENLINEEAHRTASDYFSKKNVMRTIIIALICAICTMWCSMSVAANADTTVTTCVDSITVRAADNVSSSDSQTTRMQSMLFVIAGILLVVGFFIGWFGGLVEESLPLLVIGLVLMTIGGIILAVAKNMSV